MDYALDPKAAMAADQTSNFISEAGPYQGTVTALWAHTAESGAKGVFLDFKADSGQTVLLYINTHDGHGAKTFGFGHLMAIIACLKQTGIGVAPMVVEKWDSTVQKRVKLNVQGYPAVTGKPLGLFLRQEEKAPGEDGKPRYGMVVAGAFQAGTQLTAREILSGKTRKDEAENYAAHEAYLKANPIKARSDKKGGSNDGGFSQSAPARTTGGGGFADFQDDIPYAPHARGIAGAVL